MDREEEEKKEGAVDDVGAPRNALEIGPLAKRSTPPSCHNWLGLTHTAMIRIGNATLSKLNRPSSPQINESGNRQ